MQWLILVLVVVGVIVFVVLRTKPKANAAPSTGIAESEPRDFIERANNWGNVPLRSFLESNRAEAVNKLIEIMQGSHGMEGSMDRKAAAYALGQIGDSALIPVFERAIARESIKGVREAMEASYVAIQKAPFDKGHNELERRKIIDDVYYKR